MDDEFVEFVVDQLRDLGDVSPKRMFGGHGLYLGQTFFGIVHHGCLYFKTNDQTRGDYEAAGMGPFQPNAKQTLKSYYEVPADILENAGNLTVWAQSAVEGSC
jgi:DNA transformation protein